MVKKNTSLSFIGIRFYKGFTLLELSLVVLFLSIFFTLLVGIHIQSHAIISRSTNKAGQRQNVYRLFNMIVETLAQAYFLPKNKHTIFLGKHDTDGEYHRDRLDFISVFPLSQRSQFREVSYYLTEDNRLIQREDEIIDRYLQAGGSHHVLLKNVKELMFRYSASRYGDTWYDDWDGSLKKRLPKRIQFRLVVQEGDSPPIIMEEVILTGMSIR